MAIGVYQIELNGKRYVGSAARRFEFRWQLHLWQLRRGIHHSKYLQRAYNKYGEEALKFSILEIAKTPTECLFLEQKYIDKICPEYNTSPTAGSPLGVKLSEETKTKMSIVRKGKPHSEEHSANISIAKMGHLVSTETRLKLSITAKGHTRWLGRKHTEEAKAKMSEAKRAMSDETKTKMSMAAKRRPANFTGKKHSEATKAKISETQKKRFANKFI